MTKCETFDFLRDKSLSMCDSIPALKPVVNSLSITYPRSIHVTKVKKERKTVSFKRQFVDGRMELAPCSLWHWMLMWKGLKGSLLTYSALFIKLFCVMKLPNAFWGRSKAGDTAYLLPSCSALRHLGSGQQKNYTCTFFIYKIGNHSEVELCVIKTF